MSGEDFAGLIGIIISLIIIWWYIEIYDNNHK